MRGARCSVCCGCDSPTAPLCGPPRDSAHAARIPAPRTPYPAGKFGKVDLSDVHDFTELPDGKVLSSSELGYLLLWEGNLIKCQVRGDPQVKTHMRPRAAVA